MNEQQDGSAQEWVALEDEKWPIRWYLNRDKAPTPDGMVMLSVHAAANYLNTLEIQAQAAAGRVAALQAAEQTIIQQNLENERAAQGLRISERLIVLLLEALEDLYSLQNGPPLIQLEAEYNESMARVATAITAARAFLSPTTNTGGRDVSEQGWTKGEGEWNIGGVLEVELLESGRSLGWVEDSIADRIISDHAQAQAAADLRAALEAIRDWPDEEPGLSAHISYAKHHAAKAIEVYEVAARAAGVGGAQ